MLPHQNRKFTRHTLSAFEFLRRFAQNSRGNTLAIAAAAVVPIAGMIGSGLDMSRAYMAQAKLQNACDASALAARRVMTGTSWSSDAQSEGERFFDFNFPSSTMDSKNVLRTVAQSAVDSSEVVVTASADVPTTIMGLFGKDMIPVSVSCNAAQDYGNNDIMLVLDVTGSMTFPPDSGGDDKIDMLRNGAVGLYRALAGASDTRTRYGAIPYSSTVNVAGSLRNRDILRDTYYLQCASGDCSYSETALTAVHIDNSPWAVSGNSTAQNIQNFRTSGNGCVEERPSIGNSDHPITISTTVTRDDIDLIAVNNNDRARQWGRYVPTEQHAASTDVCPAAARVLNTVPFETNFQSVIDAATATVKGSTYHDIGIIWAARFLSPTGMFASNNPEEWNGAPVAKHIVFLTDGEMCPSKGVYSSYGVQKYENRIAGPDASVTGCGDDQLRGLHIGRFLSACSIAKSMGMTIWVIAFDITETHEVSPCATSDGHFYTSDGSDLEDVFSRIGQGIARLRLSQ